MSVKNVEFYVDGDKLLLEVDLSKSLGLSASKKSELLAVVFPQEKVEYGKWPGLRFNLTVSADPPKAKAAPRQRLSK